MTRISPGWLGEPGVRRLMAALSVDGARPLFVGGCVRDALLGDDQSDIDIAIDVAPEETIRLAEQAGLRAIPTGIDHGTITVVADGAGFEVTTLRRDVETDGRRAVVAFTTDIGEDAFRRDFTINALYATAEGEVLDPTAEGLVDLAARRVRFIGDPAIRIREDYLRILRFFRFHVRFSDGPPDAQGLAACASLAQGMRALSVERIGAEMKRLLAAPTPSTVLRPMATSGVLDHVIPDPRIDAAPALEALEATIEAAPNWMRRLALLDQRPAPEIDKALRLSRAETQRLRKLQAAAAAIERPAILGWRYGAPVATDAALIRTALSGERLAGERLAGDLIAEIARGATQVFPLTAGDLLKAGLPPGPAIGETLRGAEDAWLASDFQLDKTALLRDFSA